MLLCGTARVPRRSVITTCALQKLLHDLLPEAHALLVELLRLQPLLVL